MIADPENLRRAFLKAAVGKRDRHEVIDFSKNLGEKLALLHAELLDGTVSLGDYRYFRIYDPKERLICAAAFRERVVHHAVMIVCEPFFEIYAIYDTYACRPGKGLHRALLRAREMTRRHPWYLKLDIRKYFDSIRHDILLAALERLLRDRDLHRLLIRVMESYNTAPGCGLPIGNLLSQHCANFYLGILDHWLLEVRRVPGYLRYMDDFVLFADSHERLKGELSHIVDFLNHRLGLTPKPPQLNKSALGVPMLGFRVFPGRILLAPRSRKRFVRKFSRYEADARSGAIDSRELVRRVTALVSFTRAADAVGFRRQIIGQRGASEGAPTA